MWISVDTRMFESNTDRGNYDLIHLDLSLIKKDEK